MFEPCATVEGNLLLPELPEAAGRRTLFCWKLKVSYDTLVHGTGFPVRKAVSLLLQKGSYFLKICSDIKFCILVRKY